MSPTVTPSYDPNYESMGCGGGWIDDAANFLSQTWMTAPPSPGTPANVTGYGLPLQECDPYISGVTYSDFSTACSTWQSSDYKITGWSKVAWPADESNPAIGSIDTLKAAILVGPVVVGMLIYEDFLSYQGGIYTCTSTGPSDINDPLEGGHAILAVGYDDVDQCFIVKNSWNTSWGENGYFRVAYSEFNGLSQFAQSAILYTSSIQYSPPAPVTASNPFVRSADLPIADFSVMDNSTTPPTPTNTISVFNSVKAQFQDNSSTVNTIVSWYWDFGDGTDSSNRNPSHNYTRDGAYNVSLEVVDANGNNTLASTGTVIVKTPPPDITVTPSATSGTCPLTVSFVTTNTGGPVVSWSWNFGDGTFGTNQSPSHNYTGAGSYFATVTATGPGGSVSSAPVEIITTAVPPAPTISVNATTGTAPLTVQFTSTNTGGAITKYEWYFADKGSSNNQNPSHTFTTGGTFTAYLEAIGPGGFTKSNSVTIVVAAPALPVPTITPSVTSGTTPLTVTFKAGNTGGPVTTYSWNFGNTTINGQSAAHTFTSAGTYTVTLTETGTGGSQSTSVVITTAAPVIPPGPTITPSAALGTCPLSVEFSAGNTGGPVTSYSWDFGNGITGSGQTASATYTSAGSYTATLTETGPGGSKSTTKSIKVIAPAVRPPVPVITITAMSNSGNCPTIAYLTAGNTGGPLSSYTWNFGNGTAGSGQITTAQYNKPGNYTITLTERGTGGSASVTRTVAATVIPLSVNFTQDVTTGTHPVTVQFTNNSTGTITGCLWSFGDGSTSVNASPSHTFNTPGTYKVTLSESGYNSTGHPQTLAQSVNITVK